MSGALDHSVAGGLDGRVLEGARRTDLSRMFGGPRPEPVPAWLRDGARSLGIRVARADAARAIPGALPPGTPLKRWVLDRPLGAGGQGIVYLARRMGASGERAAVKVPRGDVSERFMREARILCRLDHPQIVRLLDVSFDGPIPYIAMDLHAGGSLADAISALRACGHGAAFTPERILAIASSVLDALAYAHGHGVVHRDVKPANIFFTEDARVLVGDFGIGTLSLAKAADGSAAGGAHPSGPFAPSLVASGSIGHTRALGTPAYMAPEQEDPARAPPGGIDGRADLFALGKALYEAITLRSPRTVRPVSLDRSDLPKAWDAFIFRLVEDRPEDRFPSAAAAQEALAALSRSAAFSSVDGAANEGALRGDARGVIFGAQAEAASVTSEAYARGYQDALAAGRRVMKVWMGPDAPATREDVQDAVRQAIRARPTASTPPPLPLPQPDLATRPWRQEALLGPRRPSERNSLTVLEGGDIPLPIAIAVIFMAVGLPMSLVRGARTGLEFEVLKHLTTPAADTALFMGAFALCLTCAWMRWRRRGLPPSPLTPPPPLSPHRGNAAETERIR